MAPFTIAELLLLLAVGIILYRLLRPIQQRMEWAILKVLRRGSKNKSTVIDADFRRK